MGYCTVDYCTAARVHFFPLLKWIEISCFPLDALVDVVEPFVVLWASGELHEMAPLLTVPHPISHKPDKIAHIFRVSDGQKEPKNIWGQGPEEELVVFYVSWFCACENSHWFLLEKNMQWPLCSVTAFPGLNLNVERNWELCMNYKFSN